MAGEKGQTGLQWGGGEIGRNRNRNRGDLARGEEFSFFFVPAWSAVWDPLLTARGGEAGEAGRGGGEAAPGWILCCWGGSRGRFWNPPSALPAFAFR